MRQILIAITALFLVVMVTDATADGKKQKKDIYEIPELCPALKNELFGFIVAAHQTPEDYILGKFTEHDIIFLGEFHRIKQHVLLIQNLIPKLYENGICHLGIEYALYEDQPLIDSLIQSDTYDESLARDLLFNQFPLWGYQEYADIFKAAWALNKDLPEGNEPFRIIGLNVKADWSHVTSPEDQDNPEVKKLVWERGNPDEFMAANIIGEFVEKNKKALIFCGLHHAFTDYKMPTIDEESLEFAGFVENRAGNIVHDSIGEKTMTVVLHAPWINAGGYSYPLVYPVDGMIDALLAALPAFYRNVGFDVKGTPFGSLPAKKTFYKYGYTKFSLADFCDGYICQGTLSSYTGVTPIENFINQGNLADAKQQVPVFSLKADSISAEHLNAAIRKDADIPYRFRKYE